MRLPGGTGGDDGGSKGGTGGGGSGAISGGYGGSGGGGECAMHTHRPNELHGSVLLLARLKWRPLLLGQPLLLL